jgi:hypothetical protein
MKPLKKLVLKMQLLQKFNLMMLIGMQAMFNIMLLDGHLHQVLGILVMVQVLPTQEQVKL